MCCLCLQGASWADDSKDGADRAARDLDELQRLVSALQVNCVAFSLL